MGKVDDEIENVCQAIPFYKKGLHNPGEQWFWNIREGDKPDTNPFADYAVQMIDFVLKGKPVPIWRPEIG